MLQNIPTEKIIEIARQGPTFPAKIAKQLGGGGDTMLIGAILSTLISSGDLKVSTLKIGGSPLYYVPEQESKLEDFLSYLNDKDKKTFRLLKENQVLQDSTQDPLTRVSLRTIKDFAKSFEIDFNKQKLVFWRFYSLSREDAVILAKKIASDVKSTETEAIVTAPIVQRVEQRIESVQEHKPSLILDPKPVAIERPVVVEHHVDVVQQVLEEPASSLLTVHSEKVHDKQEQKHEYHDKPQSEKSQVEKHESPKVHTAKSPKAPKTPKPAKVPKTPKVPKPPKIDYNFFELILNHVVSKRLDVISKEKIKKTEYDLILKNHSNNEYIYCKAKDKPTINEGDLAPALIFAQNKKMPCLFLSTGDLSKTASILITKEFSGVLFEKISVNHNDGK